jgi:histone arginine demethylase JMJD6
VADPHVRVGVDADAFLREYVIPRRPVVLADLSGLAAQASAWSPERLRSELGTRELHIPEDERTVSLGAALRKIARTERAGDDTSALPYTRNVWLLEALPELGEEVVEPFFASPNLLRSPPLRGVVPDEWAPWREFFVSAPGVLYPEVHVDTHGTHAWLCQMWGAKRCYLWPPRSTGLTERVQDTLQQVDVTPHTDLETLFEHAAPVVVDLHAGQTAFVPAGWWHTTVTLELSVTVSGNFLSPWSVDDFFEFARLDDNEKGRAYGALQAPVRQLAEELAESLAPGSSKPGSS